MGRMDCLDSTNSDPGIDVFILPERLPRVVTTYRGRRPRQEISRDYP
jgi:hypothetical protein